jgi:hypothetical protein
MISFLHVLNLCASLPVTKKNQSNNNKNKTKNRETTKCTNLLATIPPILSPQAPVITPLMTAQAVHRI